MSSHYSCSPEDDFFQSLSNSLTVEYSSQMMSNFISDLIVAISNVDGDPEDGFIFYDDENDDSERYECFTLPLSQTHAFHESCRQNEAPQNAAANMSVDMFDDESSENTSLKNEATTTSRKESDNVSVDMFADFQSDIEVMDADSNCSVEVNFNAHSNDVDCQNGLNSETEDLDRIETLNPYEQRDVEEILNELEMDQVSAASNVVLPQDIDASYAISTDVAYECPRVDIPTTQKLVLQQIESEKVTTGENIENDKLSQSLDVLVCVPSNISCSTNNSNCEPNYLRVELEPSPTVHQNVQPARSESENLHKSSSTIEKSLEEGSMSERLFTPIEEIANTSIQSTSRSSDFHGFSSVGSFRKIATLQKPIGCLPRFGIEFSANLCDEYDIANSLVAEIRRASSPSTNFRGFSPVGSFRNRATFQKPIDCLPRLGSELSTNICEEYEIANSVVASSRSTNFSGFLPVAPMVQSSQSGNDLNTTFCEEYETVKSFIADLNATRGYNFSFEQAYSQCFLENQSQNENLNNADRRQTFIDEIEKLILRLRDDLVCGRKLAINIPYAVSWDNCVFDNERFELTLKNSEKVENVNVFQSITETIEQWQDSSYRIQTQNCVDSVRSLVRLQTVDHQKNLHEKNLSFLNDDLAIPSIRWIGVYPSEIKKLNLKSLPLTKADISRVDRMIKRTYLSKKIRKELMELKKTKQKTEVEALTSSGIDDWIGSYLLKKIRKGSFI